MAKSQFSEAQLSLFAELKIDPSQFESGLNAAVLATTNAAKKMVTEFQSVQNTLDNLKTPTQLVSELDKKYKKGISNYGQSAFYDPNTNKNVYAGKELTGTSEKELFDEAKQLRAEIFKEKARLKVEAARAILDIGKTAELDKFNNIKASLEEKWSIKDKIGFNSAQFNRGLLEAGKAAGMTGKELEGMMKKGDGAAVTMGNIFKRAMETVPVWMVIRTGVQFVTQSFQQLISAAIAWQSEMASVKIVARGTTEEYEQLSSQLLKLGSVYGVQMKQLGEGARLWAQQGKTISEIIPLMETTIKLSMLSGKTLVDSASAITAIMKNYGIAAEHTGVIVDKLVKIDLEHAVTVDVLVDAMKRAGPQAAQMGISFDKLLGIITATHVATRATGEQIGNAWKTIFARMSTSAIDAIQNMAKVPVYLKDMKPTTEQTTKFRDWGTILDEVALSYMAMDEVQKQSFGKQLGQLRQINLITSAFQQWEEGIQATVESIGAFGTADTAMNILLGTTESKMNQLSAAWNELGVSIIENGEFIKDAIGWLQELVKGINDLNLLYLKGNAGREKYWGSLDNQAAEERIKIRNKEISQIEAYNSLLKEQEKLNEWQKRLSESTDSDKEKKLQILSNREKFLQEQVTRAGNVELYSGTSLKDATKDPIYRQAWNQWDTDQIDNNNKKMVVAIKLQKELDEARQKVNDTLSFKTPISSLTVWIDTFGIGFEKLKDKTLPQLQKQLGVLKNMASKGLIDNKVILDFEKLITLEEDNQKIGKRSPVDSNYYVDFIKNQQEMKKLEDEARLKGEAGGIVSDQVQFDKELKFLEAKKSLGYSDLEISEMKLKMYDDYANKGKAIDSLSKLKEEETINRDILITIKTRNDLLAKENTTILEGQTLGNSALETEKLRLSLMIERKEGLQAIADQEKKIADLTIEQRAKDILTEQNTIILKGKVLGDSALESEKIRLSLMIKRKESMQSIVDQEQKIADLTIEKQGKNLLDKEDSILNSLISKGYTQLEIEKVHLNMIRERHKYEMGASDEEMEQLKLIAKMRQDSINETSNKLKDSLSGSINNVMSGEGNVGDLFGNIQATMIDSYRKTTSESLSSIIMGSTGIGDIFGGAMEKLKEAFGIVGNKLENKIDVSNLALSQIVENTAAMAGVSGATPSSSVGGGTTAGGTTTSGGLLGMGIRKATDLWYGVGKTPATQGYRPGTTQSSSGGLAGNTSAAADAMRELAKQQKSQAAAGLIGGGVEGIMTGYSAYQSAKAGGASPVGSTMAGLGGLGMAVGGAMVMGSAALGVWSSGAAAGTTAAVGAANSWNIVGWIILIIAAVLMLASLFIKSKPSTQTSSETRSTEAKVSSKIDITNKQLEIVNRNLVALKNTITTYILPSSIYFTEKYGLDEQFAINSRRGVL